MLKNLVLDIGNVICLWDAKRLCSMAFPDAAEHPGIMAEALAATAEHPDWLKLDRGTISVAQAIKNAQQRSNLNPEQVAALYHQLPASLSPINSTVEAMYEAHKAGIDIYILSNMQDHAWRYLEANHEFWSTCKGVVVSCDTGFIKPEKAIYEHLCTRFGLNAEECLFIDDMPENVEAAIACGWQSVQLKTPSDGGDLIRQWLPKFKQ